MTLSDTGKTAVHWTPTATTHRRHRQADRAGEDHDRSQQRVPEAGLELHRCHPELPHGVERRDRLPAVRRSARRPYMNAYLPSASCLPTKARGRAQMRRRRATRSSSSARPRPSTGSRSARPPRSDGRRFLEPRQDDGGRREERRRAAPASQREHHAGLREVLSASGRASSSRSTSSRSVYGAIEIRSRSSRRPIVGISMRCSSKSRCERSSCGSGSRTLAIWRICALARSARCRAARKLARFARECDALLAYVVLALERESRRARRDRRRSRAFPGARCAR